MSRSIFRIAPLLNGLPGLLPGKTYSPEFLKIAQNVDYAASKGHTVRSVRLHADGRDRPYGGFHVDL
jgi:hypothetical protein